MHGLRKVHFPISFPWEDTRKCTSLKKKGSKPSCEFKILGSNSEERLRRFLG
jgi:hypothetical protein